MESISAFRDLPSWATVLGGLLAALVAMTVLSMIVGVVFAGIALGIELGSATVGIAAVLLGLAMVLVPIAVGATMLRQSDDESVGEPTDPVESLRTQYVDGELDEQTFERRLDALLEESNAELSSNRRMRDDRTLLEERDER